MLSRRGFLKTLGAALGAAAVFEPKSMLWLPKPADAPLIVTAESDAAARILIERQLELNDLALRFAQLAGSRIVDSRAMALHQVVYRLSGNVVLTSRELLADDVDVDASRFQALPRTMIVTNAARPDLDMALGQMALHDADMFVPIGAELRPGEPFADGTMVGVATDVESGMSARAITVQSNRRRESFIGFELAAGTWRGPHRRREPLDSLRDRYRRGDTPFRKDS